MSDWSGERDPLVAEWMVAAALLFGVAPFALVRLCGGSWGTFAVGWGVLLLLAGLAWVGRWVRRWVQGWRADRVLRREETTGLVLVPAVADKPGMIIMTEPQVRSDHV